LDYSYKPITNTQPQVIAHGMWFSPASSTTKTGRHLIAEILLKVTLSKHQINQIIICE
jgi:hypothetical protein